MSIPNKYMLFSALMILVFSKNHATAQSKDLVESKAEIFMAKNVLHADFAWSAVGYSLNYGRIIFQKDKLKLAGSAGFSMLFQDEIESIHSGYVKPVFLTEITAFSGRSKHNLEFGTGFYTYRDKRYYVDGDIPGTTTNKAFWVKSIVPRVGYRYQKPEGGFFFRIGYTPRIDFINEEFALETVNFYFFGLSSSLGLSF